MDAAKALRYRQYAEEAVYFACLSLSGEDRLALLDIASKWADAAAYCDVEDSRASSGKH